MHRVLPLANSTSEIVYWDAATTGNPDRELPQFTTRTGMTQWCSLCSNVLKGARVLSVLGYRRPGDRPGHARPTDHGVGLSE